MTLLKECKSNFNTKDLYEVLGCSKSADNKQLKKAYYKSSLKVHPDRVDESEKEDATVKFQIINKVFSILSDEEKRSTYDETGEVDDDFEDDADWDKYWRLFFKKISVSDIKNFEKQYKDSKEELEDLKKMYIEGKGCMNFILENVLCATEEDEERFVNIIQDWIKKKEVEKLPKFLSETEKQKKSRKKKAAAEAVEAEKLSKDLGLNVDSEESLAQLIKQRSKEREVAGDAFLDGLAAKYGQAGNKRKRK